MEVKVRNYFSDDYMVEGLEITINSATKFHVYSDAECPEDNNLSRNFADCYDIPELLQMAYEAGKRGEDFKITYIEDEEY